MRVRVLIFYVGLMFYACQDMQQDRAAVDRGSEVYISHWGYSPSLNTKFGCGIGQCGACTMHIDDLPMRSCCTPVSHLEDKSVITIEVQRHSRTGA